MPWFITTHRSMSPILIVIAIYVFGIAAQDFVPEIPPNIFLSSVANQINQDSSLCQQACVAVSSLYPSSVFIGQTGDFDFWDAKQAEIIPACRVEPGSANEASRMLKEIVQHQCHFAIKSGGHDRTPGASNADGGITIDLVRLNQIEVAEDEQSVTIGAGLRWEDVYDTLEKRNLMVLGGRISDVGVGGLLLGGGISFYSNERGLACDSVLSYEMVLPNASVIVVNRNSQPDLYKALRGAGASNFGVVTSFTLESFPIQHPQGIWTGQKVYQWDEMEALLQANHKTVTQSLDNDPHMAVMNIFTCLPVHKLCYGAIQSQHTSHNSLEEWPDSLRIYDEIEGLRRTVKTFITPSSNVTRRLRGTTNRRKHRTIYGTFTYTPSTELETEILAIYLEVIDAVRDMTGFSPSIVMHPLSTTMIAKMSKRGGNSLQSVAGNKGPLVILNVSWQWYESIDDERAYDSYYRLTEQAESAAKRLGVWHPYKYINYAESTQDIWSGYGEESARELRALQRKIDPRQIFTKGGLASGFFKLNEYRLGNEDVSEDRWDKSEL